MNQSILRWSQVAPLKGVKRLICNIVLQANKNFKQMQAVPT